MRMLVVWEIGKWEEENCSQTKQQRPLIPIGFAGTQ